MDPLTLLREYNTRRQLGQVELLSSNGRVKFGDRYDFNSDYQAYRRQDGGFYTLDVLVFFLKNRNFKANEYLLAAKQANVPQVQLQDRKKLLDFFDGLLELDVELQGASGLPQTNEALEPQAKRQRVEDEANAMRNLQEVERQLRNRNTMLIAPTRDFHKVLDVLEQLKKAGKKQAAAAPEPHRLHQPTGSRPEQAARPTSRYERDSASDQLKQMAGTNAIGVNMYGPSAPAARPTSSDGPGTTGYVAVGKSAAPVPVPAPAPRVSMPLPKPGNALSAAPAKRHGTPIILVPSGLMSCLLNMYNARTFFEDGKYVPVEQAQAMSGSKRGSAVAIMRRADRDPPVKYVISEKAPAKDKKDEWEKVVAVVVQGATWQFKDWPHKGADKGDLVEAFSKVCGFYLHYADEKVKSPVAEWNVKRLPLPRQERHKDRTILNDLFKHLDKFLGAKNCSLAY